MSLTTPDNYSKITTNSTSGIPLDRKQNENRCRRKLSSKIGRNTLLRLTYAITMHCCYERAPNYESHRRLPPQTPKVSVLSSLSGGSKAQARSRTEVKREPEIQNAANALNHLLENYIVISRI